MAEETVLLTGLPVSEEMKEILHRCERGEYVPVEVIADTPEMRTARTFVPDQTSTVQLKNRENIQKQVFDIISSYGSVSLNEEGTPQVDSEGHTLYNGVVDQGGRLDIVIGLPSSGKSSTIVDVISYEQHSMLIDSDEAKRQFPEFNEGWGASIVHQESQMIEHSVFYDALMQHKNIVIPKVGSKAQHLLNDYILPAKDVGYRVNVHFADLDRNKALGRMLNRFIQTGRYIPPSLIDKYVNERDGNRIAQTFKQLSGSSFVDGISRWDMDVAYGKNPILKEFYGLLDFFVVHADYVCQNSELTAEILGSYMQEHIGRDCTEDILRMLQERENLSKSMDSLTITSGEMPDEDAIKMTGMLMRGNIGDMRENVEDGLKRALAVQGITLMDAPQEVQEAVLNFRVEEAKQQIEVAALDAMCQQTQIMEQKEYERKGKGPEYGYEGKDAETITDTFTRGESNLYQPSNSRANRRGVAQSGNGTLGETGRDERIVTGRGVEVSSKDIQQTHVSGEKIEAVENDVVEQFRMRTKQCFHEIDGETPESIESMVKSYMEDLFMDYDIDATVVEVVLEGSRSRGFEREDSDLDIVAEIHGDVREDDLLALLKNNDWLQVGGVKIDINPITPQKSGTLTEYLPGVEADLAERAPDQINQEVNETEKPVINEYLSAVEMQEEENYNMIDHVINNTGSRDEKIAEKQGRKTLEKGSYSNVKFEKRIENQHYLMLADIHSPTGEETKQKAIAEFPSKESAKDFCRQNRIRFCDVTNYLKNRIAYKKYKLNENSGEPSEQVQTVGKQKGRGGDLNEGL